MAGCGSKKMAKGGMAKKVRGYAEGGSVNKMRSESTENAKSGRKALQAAIDEETAKTDFERAHYMAGLTGEEQFKGDSRVNAALFRRAIRERAAADQEAIRKGKETGYSRFDGQVGSRSGDEERLANSPIGVEDGRLKYAKGGLVKKLAKGKMAKGGLMVSPRKKMAMGMKMGGAVKKYAKGGMAKKGCK